MLISSMAINIYVCTVTNMLIMLKFPGEFLYVVCIRYRVIYIYIPYPSVIRLVSYACCHFWDSQCTIIRRQITCGKVDAEYGNIVTIIFTALISQIKFVTWLLTIQFARPRRMAIMWWYYAQHNISHSGINVKSI